MQLNLSTDIALRTLIYLGQKGESATIAEVSEAYDISKTHLMKVVMELVICMKNGATNDVLPLDATMPSKEDFFKAQNAFLTTLDESSLADLL